MRIIRPELISRTKARATCTTTSVFRARWRWRLSLAPRPAVRNAAHTAAGITNGGNQPKQQARKNGNGEREKNGPRIHGNLLEARKIGGMQDLEQAQSGERQACANRAAGDTEHQAFQQQFARNLPPAGAECGANGELLLPALRAYEHQVGNIGAGNQQDHSDGAHEHPEHAADVSQQARLERCECGRDTRRSKLARDNPGNGGKLRRATGISRAQSAPACASDTPGLSRAIPEY